ncbi:hypothetical protein GOP47_0028482 [Adiantum capillus-veneris]|nr:hypothetical protein GOP47_0028482 [Adiantum capillus-veneris]
MLLGELPKSVQKETLDWWSDLDWLNLGGVLYELAVSIHSSDETLKAKNVIDFILDCRVPEIMTHNYQLLISRRSKVTSERMDDAFATSRGKRIETLGKELNQRLSQADFYVGGRESVGLDSEKVISLGNMLTNFCSTGVESEVAKMLAQRQLFGGPVHLATTSKAYSMRRIFGDKNDVVTEVDLVGITQYSALEFLRKRGSCPDTRFSPVDVVQGVATDSCCLPYTEEMTNVMQGYAEWRLYEKLYPEIKGVYEGNDCNWVVCEVSMSKNIDECMRKVLQLEADLLVLLCNLHEKKTEFCIHPLQLAKIRVWCLVALLLKPTFSQNMDQLIRNCIFEIPCCRVLMLQGRLLWGFFRSEYFQRSFSQVQNWGFSMQNSLRDVSNSSEFNIGDLVGDSSMKESMEGHANNQSGPVQGRTRRQEVEVLELEDLRSTDTSDIDEDRNDQPGQRIGNDPGRKATKDVKLKGPWELPRADWRVCFPQTLRRAAQKWYCYYPHESIN